MPFRLSPELKSFQEMLERFSRERVRPRAAAADESQTAPADLLLDLHHLGFSRAQFPEEYGGLGEAKDCLPAAVIAAEAVGRGCAGIALAAPGPGLLGWMLLAAGTEEQKRRIFARFAEVTPAYAGYSLGIGLVPPDFSRVEVEAWSERAGYILQGKQSWVLNFDRAEIYLVAARVGSGQPAELGWFCVEKGTAGLVSKSRISSMGLCAAVFGELALEGCRVPPAARLGENCSGERLETGRVDYALILSAVAAGLLDGALEYTLAYAEDRVQFGGPIIEREAIGLMLGEMKRDLELGRALLWQAVGDGDAEHPRTDQAISAAAFWAERVSPHLSNALQILGGYGFIRDYPCEKWLRDAKTLEVLMGSPERQKLKLLDRLRRPGAKTETRHG